jgi:carbonic anhydrase/acetyltransferase-like protein (isoleucine patch superfamily)
LALILSFNGKTPRIAKSAFVAPTAVIVGDVEIGENASVWFGAVIRGDHPENNIVVGAGTSVQENAVVHVGRSAPTLIGENVTVGHGAKFESCSIGDRTIIGMNAVILKDVTIGSECVIAANSVILEGTEIRDRSVVAGVPGTLRKAVAGSSAQWMRDGGQHYVHLSRAYLAEGIGTEAMICELCGGLVLERHCKIVCQVCGYQRDYSDP